MIALCRNPTLPFLHPCCNPHRSRVALKGSPQGKPEDLKPQASSQETQDWLGSHWHHLLLAFSKLESLSLGFERLL